jgi:O-antigen/teichoic acid export membrane protein
MTHQSTTLTGTAAAGTRVDGSTSGPPGIVAVARGGLANLGGAALAGLSGFAVTWLVARALGSVQAGAFFASTAAFVLISMIAKLGTQTSLVYWPARLRAFGNVGALRACLRTALLPVAVVSLVIAATMWFGASALARIAVHDGRAGYAHQLRVLAVFLPAAAMSDTLLAATRGWRALKPTVMLDRLLRPGLQVGALAVLIALDVATPTAFVLAWVAPYLLSAALAGRALGDLLHTAEATGLPVPPPTARHAADAIEPWVPADFWRFTMPRAFASVAQLALQRVDVLLLASIAGLRAAAIYAVAGRFVVLGQFANQGISQAAAPRLAEQLSTGDRAGANALYQTATTWLILAAWPLYLMIAVFAGAYLGAFGSGYATGGPVVVVLAAAMTVATGCGMVDVVLSMAGRTSWNLVNVTIALIAQLAIDVALIPHLGPLGAAIGLGVAITVNNVLPLIQIARTLGVHPLGTATLTSAFLTVGCFGVIPVGVAATLGTGLGAAAVALAVGGSVYLLGLVRFRGVLRLGAFARMRRH